MARRRPAPPPPPPAPPAPIPAAYDADALAARIRRAVAPADALEEVWAEDAIALTLEIGRLRWVKQRMIATNRQKALGVLLSSLTGYREKEDIVERWAQGDAAAARRAEQLLEAAGLSTDDIDAKAFELRIKEIGQVEAMIAAAEARRNGAIREVERYRSGLAARLRSAPVEDADFTEVDPAAGPRGEGPAGGGGP